MKRTTIAASFLCCGFLLDSIALAQFPERQRKMKKREAYDQNAMVNDSEGEANGEEKSSSWWFPNWQPPSFDWILHPAAGFKAENDKTSAYTRASASSEIGLRLALNGVPIVSGNPGFYLKPQAGYAAGTYNTKMKPTGGKEQSQSGSFSRYFYGTDLNLYLGFYKHTLGVTAGTLQYSGDRTDAFHSLSILNDFGFLLLRNLSTHLTLDYVTAYEDSYSKPTIQEKDHWLHLKVFFDYFNINFDTGPGFSTVDLWGKDATGNRIKVGDGQTNYYLTLFSMDLYWKLGLSARVNYVYDAPQFNAAASELVAGNRLPTQSLNDAQAISTLPDDSMDSQFFLGARNLYAGLGIGYNYHLLQLNYSEKDGRKRQTYRDQGLSVVYDVAF